MADLEELMTDEVEGTGFAMAWPIARNALRAELRPGYQSLKTENANARQTIYTLTAEISTEREQLRALRESHDALFMALVTCERKLEEEAPLTEGVAWALDKAKAALDTAQPLTATARR